MNFKDFDIISPIGKTLEKKWFITPTPIQEAILKESLETKDIFWVAKTGSGKTLSFVISVLSGIYKDKIENPNTFLRWLILAPTRELAIQIWEVIKDFASDTNLRYTTIFWWVNQFHQVKKIEKNLDLIIATPGRLLDLEEQKLINLETVKYFVLDEADKMLDMWFFPDIKIILKKLPTSKQSLFFSATISEEIEELSKKITNDFKIIKSNEENQVNTNINHEVLILQEEDKLKALQYFIKKQEYKSIIVFVNTKDDTDEVLWFVKMMWITCDNIHRNRSQNARQRAIQSIKSWEIKALIATDIASRWIDIDNLSLVINYSLPKDSEVYIHRIWRTARAGNSWFAISFCTQKELPRLESIENLIWGKIKINNDTKYLDEIVVKWEYLWNFWDKKEVQKKKKRYYK